jgi:hypothetical protein
MHQHIIDEAALLLVTCAAENGPFLLYEEGDMAELTQIIARVYNKRCGKAPDQTVAQLVQTAMKTAGANFMMHE